MIPSNILMITYFYRIGIALIICNNDRLATMNRKDWRIQIIGVFNIPWISIHLNAR